MVSKDNRRNSYSQSVPASKSVSKIFVIIAISVAALVVLGVFLLLTKGQFVGKATFTQVAQQAPSTTQTEPSTQLVQQAPSTESTAPTTPVSPTPVSTDTISTDTLQNDQLPITPSTSDDLQIDLELDRVDRTHSWVNVYLTSASHDQIAGMSFGITFEGVTGQFTKAEVHPLFKSITSSVSGGIVSFEAGENVIIPIAPLAKTYVGRAYFQTLNGPPVNFKIVMYGDAKIAYSSGKFYLVSMAPLSACAPSGNLDKLIPNVNCGAWADGCGGFVDAGSCTDGNVCVANSCQSAVSQLSSQDQLLCQGAIAASAKDKNLLGGVINALKNTDQLDAVLDVFAALNEWLKP